MLFKHPKGKRLALTTGHVTHVGTEWQELSPIFHEEAMNNGCHCDQQFVEDRTPPPITASDEAMAQLDEREAITAALKRMVMRGDDNDFTRDGLPNLNTLKTECGFPVDKALAYDVFQALKAAVAEGGDTDTTTVE